MNPLLHDPVHTNAIRGLVQSPAAFTTGQVAFESANRSEATASLSSGKEPTGVARVVLLARLSK